jgi:hypothetical protein
MNKKDKLYFQEKIINQMESVLQTLFDEQEFVLSRDDGEENVCSVCGKEIKLCKSIRDFRCPDCIKGNSELYELERSLQRISRGTYGFCLKCNEMISKDILDKNLTALFCNNCKPK